MLTQRSRTRERSRSPRRRNDYDERSPSRTRYRERHGSANGNGTRDYNAAPSRGRYEDRGPGKEQMLSNVKESSQQDRRVYVGNLSYDVKWNHLKDFMRQGTRLPPPHHNITPTDSLHSWRGDLRRCITTSEWNEQG